MEIGSGLNVWKVEPYVGWRSWGLGFLIGDPEGLGEDVGVSINVGPLHLFVGRGLTWRDPAE